MTLAREDRRPWSVVSLLLHAAIIALLAIPGMMLHTSSDLVERAQGAGGPGPAGGGGGGNRGTGGRIAERIEYIRIAPPPPPTPAVTFVPPVQPPPTPLPEPPKVEPPKPDPAKVVATAPEVTAAVPGAGGGSGNDGSSGMGPGSGGGVGSGVGTGRGSGVGAGTGGGTQANYPPSPDVLYLPPLPVPPSVRGAHVLAQFDVDSTGKVLWWAFSPTRDRGYNKQLEETLKSIRWKPGVTPAGRPVRDTAQLSFDLP